MTGVGRGVERNTGPASGEVPVEPVEAPLLPPVPLLDVALLPVDDAELDDALLELLDELLEALVPVEPLELAMLPVLPEEEPPVAPGPN